VVTDGLKAIWFWISLVPFEFPLCPGGFKLSVPFFEDFFVPGIQFVHWSDVADSTMQPDVVVMLDVLCHNPADIVKR